MSAPVIALLLAVWLLATIGLRPLLLPDEGRYAGVAFEMLRGVGPADALTPTLAGLPFFHKPPLLYWLDMAAMSVLGVNPFAARFGPAVFAWVLGMALFLHLRRWFGAAVAQPGLVLLATTPLFFIGGQYVNHDIGVAACITAAVLSVVRAVDDPARTSRRWLILAWAFCGLGVLAKGLIGIVLPGLIVAPWLLAQGRWRQVLSLLHPLGLLAFVAVVSPWMWVMQQRFVGFFDYFIIEQHFRRFTGTTFNNRMPFWFYWVVLPLLMLPWTLWLAGLRAVLPKITLPNSALTAIHPKWQLALYGWWILVIVGFFSLPASKLVGYVMPAMAPLSAVLAWVVVQRGTPWRRIASVSALVCVALVTYIAWKAPGSHRELAFDLAAQMQPGDRVVFVEDYFYDVPFYAKLAAPAVVMSDWTAPDVAAKDNWRKELFDATRFAPDKGAHVLWTWDRLSHLPCGTRQLWLVAAEQHHQRLTVLPGLTLIKNWRGIELLRAGGQTSQSDQSCAKP
jgi:4-amino-4-deoxy-L-arabinose transferase-like glycosyltransferase